MMLDENTLKCAEIVINFFTGIALFWLGYEANKLVRAQNKRLSTDEKKVYLENYNKVSKAFALCRRDAGVKDEAHSLIWNSYSEAKVQLPDDIVEHTKEWHALLDRAYMIGRQCYDDNGNPRQSAQSKWSELLDEEAALIRDIYEVQPETIYRKYIAVD